MKMLQEGLVSAPIISLPRITASDISSILMLARNKSVPCCCKNSWMDSQDHLKIGQGLSHKPSVRTIRPSTNDSLSYGHSCSFDLTWKGVDLSYVQITPPSDEFETSLMILGNPHDDIYAYPNTNSTSVIDLK